MLWEYLVWRDLLVKLWVVGLECVFELSICFKFLEIFDGIFVKFLFGRYEVLFVYCSIELDMS